MADDRLCNYLIVNSNKVCKGEEVRSKQLVGKKSCMCIKSAPIIIPHCGRSHTDPGRCTHTKICWFDWLFGCYVRVREVPKKDSSPFKHESLDAHGAKN